MGKKIIDFKMRHNALGEERPGLAMSFCFAQMSKSFVGSNEQVFCFEISLQIPSVPCGDGAEHAKIGMNVDRRPSASFDMGNVHCRTLAVLMNFE